MARVQSRARACAGRVLQVKQSDTQFDGLLQRRLARVQTNAIKGETMASWQLIKDVETPKLYRAEIYRSHISEYYARTHK
jgi:hypothetical protein